MNKTVRVRPIKWKKDSAKNGIVTFTLSSWKYFQDFFAQELLDTKNYVFRGQSDETWKLEPSIHRILKHIGKTEYKSKIKFHLENFKYSLRGRVSNLKDIITDNNELWAIGQHHGLHTPLLDFTFSPYVAAYFAFVEVNKETKYRIIYCLSQYAINKQIDDELNIYRPVSDHNPRLLNQSGLFVRFDTELDIEALFKIKYREKETMAKLYKIKIPNKDREVCLKFLNRMNINHNTLFPDITGASIYCNMELAISNY